MEPDGAVTVLHSFGGSGDTGLPSVLLQATDGDFYGIGSAIGVGIGIGIGAIFRMKADGTVTIVYAFPGYPALTGTPVGLIQSSDGNFVGTTTGRTPDSWGTVFRMTPAGLLTILYEFPAAGSTVGHIPATGVIEASDGNFYGMTTFGGASGDGTVFRLTSAGVATKLHDIEAGRDGSRPRASLFEAADGSLYGTHFSGLAPSAQGSVFKVTSGGGFSVLHRFGGPPDGAYPSGGITQAADGTLYGTTERGGAVDFGTVFTMDAAGAVTLLHEFRGGVEGALADSPLVQGTDGNLYGATCRGGLNNAGTVFRSTRTGGFAVLYTFLGTADGLCPKGLVQASNGSLYGTTSLSGQFGGGTVFRMSLSGGFAVLHAFGEGTDGRSPAAPLIQATDGYLYGTTASGGAANRGTVFRMTLSGDLEILHPFAGGSADGSYPRTAVLQSSEGQFYGSTSLGGISDRGTLFRMTSSGTVTLLHSFSGSASGGGYAPAGPLVQGAGSKLYGASSYLVSITPQTYYFCSVFFEVFPAGGLSVLGTGSRCGGGFGIGLSYWLVARRNGSLLGIESGSSIVEFPLTGSIRFVYGLGGSSVAPLIEGTDAHLYGVTMSGGEFGAGTIFRLRYGPDAPGGLSVSPSGSNVRLTWSATPTAVTYTVKRSTSPGTETLLATGLAGTDFVDTTALRGQRYYYVVTATNAFGEGLVSYEVSITPGRAVPADFDRDGKSDITVFRPSTGAWYIRQSTNGALETITWGGSGDMPVPGDYDGDGQADAGVFRPSSGVWYIRPSSTAMLTAIGWGESTDIPVPGDYDGDGLTDAAVFRPSTGAWYIRQSSTFTLLSIRWGLGTDTPAPGDYDGDGLTDAAVFRASTGRWYARLSGTFTLAATQWGAATDTPVADDYDGDGKTDVAVFDAPAHAWNVAQSGAVTTATLFWGDPGDVPVGGDYDGDGKADIAVFRPPTGVWYIRLSTTGEMLSGPWGEPTDVPILERR